MENKCPFCGKSPVKEITGKYPFTYGATIVLQATYPLLQCPDCNWTWTDYRAEEAKASAVNQHLANEKQKIAEHISCSFCSQQAELICCTCGKTACKDHKKNYFTERKGFHSVKGHVKEINEPCLVCDECQEKMAR
jgi:YgiT-type zinc finger domain-containing protein